MMVAAMYMMVNMVKLALREAVIFDIFVILFFSLYR